MSAGRREAVEQIRIGAENHAAVAGIRATGIELVDGDAGRIIPDIWLLAGGKIIDLCGLLNAEQVVALAKVELDDMPESAPVIVVAKFP